jgi:hypothetical protein
MSFCKSSHRRCQRRVKIGTCRGSEKSRASGSIAPGGYVKAEVHVSQGSFSSEVMCSGASRPGKNERNRMTREKPLSCDALASPAQ